MLTNFDTIRKSVRYMEKLEAQEADGTMAALTKKEQILLRKEMAKLQTNLNGIRNMKKVPDAVFVVDSTREEIAVKEALKLGIPIVGTIDTNSNPDVIDYGIPVNDDAIRSVELLIEFIAEAVIAGVGAISVDEMLEEKKKKEAEEKKKEEDKKKKELVEKEAQTIDEILSDNNSEEKLAEDAE